MQTPLALRARNPDKAQNTNRMIQSPRLSNMLYHSTGPMGSQSHSNYLNRQTGFQKKNPFPEPERTEASKICAK